MPRPNRLIHVVAGVLADDRGRVLLQQRRSGSHQGGLWEFPGGKVETGEDSKSALRRELLEELGIELIDASHLITVNHDYGDRQVRLEVFSAVQYEGDVMSLEGQPLRWVRPIHLAGHAMPAADHPVIEAILLANY